jgi:acetolactate synthase-1/2/3 large subunit
MSSHLAAECVSALLRAGVQVVYGVPGGGANLDVVGAAEAHGLRFVLVHGEASGAIMAAVDGELTGRPGACVVTRGPGAASTINGVAHALLDRSPLLLLTDDVPLSDRRRISHQYIDQASLFSPVTKWSTRIGVVGAAESFDLALAVASDPPPGPVQIAFDPHAPPPPPPLDYRRADRAPASHAISEAREILRRSRRPVLALGVGARRSASALRELVADTPWPVLTTYKAKGVIPESWSNAAGLLTGGTREGDVLRSADVILAVGLDDVELIPAPWPYEAPIVALCEWPQMHQYLEPRIEVVGSLSRLLTEVAESLPQDFDGDPGGRATPIADDEPLHDLPHAGIGPQDVVNVARAVAPEGTIATVDSGAHMLVTMPLWEVEEPDEVLISSGLATMGFAVPAAIAAALARPGRRVVCFTGDGGLGVALAELETIARLALPVTIAVFNDSMLSLIAIKQARSGQGGSSAVCYRPTNFAALAGSLGMPAERIETRDELFRAFTESLRRSGPTLLDVAVDPSGYKAALAAIRGGEYRA